MIGAGFALGAGKTVLEFGSKKATQVNCSSTTSCTAQTPVHEAGTIDVKAGVNQVGSPLNPPADQFTYG